MSLWRSVIGEEGHAMYRLRVLILAVATVAGAALGTGPTALAAAQTGLVGQFQQHREQPRWRAAPTGHLHRISAPAVAAGEAGGSGRERRIQC